MEIENDKIKPAFLAAQDEFLRIGSAAAWSAMWQIALQLAGKMIHQQQKAKNFIMDLDYYEDSRMNAVVYVLRRYRTRKGYRIKNIVSAMYFGVIHALYSRTEKDRAFNDAYLIDDRILRKLADIPVYDRRIIKTGL